MPEPRRRPTACIVTAFLLVIASRAVATDIIGVQPAALDQPRINALLSRSPLPGGAPLTADFGTGPTFNIEAFFDTGASGILLSEDTADFLGVTRQTVGGQLAVFSDVGVGGSSQFNISEPLHVGLAKYHPSADLDNLDTYQTVYNQRFGPVRTQIGPVNVVDPDPNLAGLDVMGMPLMAGKVVVFDPKPVNTFVDTMRTYVYNPGTPFDPGHASTEPGIPVVSGANGRHVKLSYGDFSRFTTTTPAGAQPPTLASNPFIGPNPVAQLDPNPPPDTTPPVKISYGTQSTQGSFLLDTGAAASIISQSKAQNLGVTYDPKHPLGSDDPRLLGVPLDQQFTLSIGGIGGTSKVAGFFLSSMLVRTQEGNAANDSDPNHLNFVDAPVLVADITTLDPNTNQSITLDGIFGMNNLVASAFITEGAPFPTIDNLTFGKFDWAVFDQPNGVLGLQLSPPRPQGELSWIGDTQTFGQGIWDINDHEHWIGNGGLAPYMDGDHVLFDDNTVNPNVRIESVVAPGGVRFDNSEETTYKFTGPGRITGLTGVIKTNSGTVQFSVSNDYTGSTDIVEGTMVFLVPQNIGPVNVHPGTTLIMAAAQQLERVNIDGGLASVGANGNRLLRTQSIAILGGGTLDLADNDAIVAQQPIQQIETMIRQARTGGSWNGSGITSSSARTHPARLTTLGSVTGAQYKLAHGNNATFDGIAVQAEDVLIKYTYLGDADLNGRVNFDDYTHIDNGFNNNLSGWYNGDFDYSGRINFDDYTLIDQAFNNQGVPLRPVPEPQALAWLFVIAALAARRRAAHSPSLCRSAGV